MTRFTKQLNGIIRGLVLAVVFDFVVQSTVAYGAGIDPALLELRRQKSSPTFNLLSYRHLDELFNTREVLQSDDMWVLEPSDKTLGIDSLIGFPDEERPLHMALSEMRANALLVMRDGKIVTEIHRNGGGEDSRYIGFSMSKSWISILVGIALKRGEINSLDDSITEYLPELLGTAYDGVSLDDLMQMRAGTSWEENYAPGTVLDGVRDRSTNLEEIFYESIAPELSRTSDPGATFNYSTLSTELVGVALQRAVRQPIADYMSDVLWKPAGMESPGYWILQGPAGAQHEWYGAGFGAQLRDFARLGQMMLDGGVANGRQVVPLDWVNLSTRAGENPNYFYFWWGISGIDGFSAQGVGGQVVMVDRESRTVMVLARYTSGGAVRGDPLEMFKSIIRLLN